MSMPISLGSVACSSTWMPSSSLLNRSLELAYSILLLTLDVSGDLQGGARQCIYAYGDDISIRRMKRDHAASSIIGRRTVSIYIPCIYYQEMKKILLFWQFSSVVKSKSKTA